MPARRKALLLSSAGLLALGLLEVGCEPAPSTPRLERPADAGPPDPEGDAAIDQGPVLDPDAGRDGGQDAGPLPCRRHVAVLDRAGGVIEVPEGALAGLQLVVPPDAVAQPLPITLDCDAPLVPEGWVPLGPAARVVGPGPVAFSDLARLRLVFDPATLSPAVSPNHLRLFWRPDDRPLILEPMVIDPEIDLAAGQFGFATPGLGVFQVAHRIGAGEPVPRRYTFKAITGISMGGGAAAYLGVKYHERFDFVGGLGGPVDWPYLIQYITGRLLSGFCPADSAAGLGGACPPPPVSHPWEHPSTYNDWFYADNGGSFDRDEYVKIFQDLAYAYGNPLLWNPESPYRTPGMPAARLRLDPTRRCLPECADPDRAAHCAAQRAQGRPCACDQLCPEGRCPADAPAPHVIEAGFFDDEYNPDGSLPVVAYCEGEDGPPLGVLDPAAPRLKPAEIMLAVDLNRNGRRDAHEPVIRNLGEPFGDVGCDGVPSHEEPGYDPITNPDPAGDDYHWYRNGAGTEGNGWRDGPEACGPGGGEPFADVGIDGVPDTPQASAGGFDLGEGNGRFDPNPNLITYLERSPGLAWRALPAEARDRLDLWIDGGIRDIFNFGVAALHLGARLQASGVNVRLYRDFPRLIPGGALAFVPDPRARDAFGQAGEAVALVYGDPQASAALIEGGDGAHVGSADQTLNRFMTLFDWVHNRWPGGDYTPLFGARTRSEDILYDSPSTGRKARYVVSLPPGYDAPENAERRYPVTLLLHGYGQRPDDLPVAGALLAGAMSRGAWQKAILVFPDGSCGRSLRRQCNDGVDNDGDGSLDADARGRRPCAIEDDAPCEGGLVCRDSPAGPWCCGADWRDCGPPDPECRRADTPAEDGSRPTRCADGVDNDLDGLVDLADGGCMGDPTQDDEAECKRGSFYTTHVAERDGSPGGPDYEGMLLDLLDDVDRRFRTKAPEIIDHPRR